MIRGAPEVERAIEPAGTAGATTVVSTAPGEGEARASSEQIALVDALGRGEPWAAQEVWDRHAASVRRLMARALGPRPEVEDLTQEVFMRVFSRSGAHPGRERSPRVRDRRGRERPQARAAAALGSAQGVALGQRVGPRDRGVPARTPKRVKRSARCYAILDKLGARERAAFVLRYMEERTFEQVATGLGVSLRTAKRLVNRSCRTGQQARRQRRRAAELFRPARKRGRSAAGKREHQPKTRVPNQMPADDDRQSEAAPDEGAPRESAIAGGGAVVSRLPAPPNARVDGLDARSAGLAAFVASEVDVSRRTRDGVDSRAREPSRSCVASRARASAPATGPPGASAPEWRWGR